MNKTLPAGWIETKLENCSLILDNFRKPINAEERAHRILNKKKDDLFPYYGATGKVGYIDDYLIDGQYVLIGEDGAPFLEASKNKAYVAEGKFWVNNHAHILKSLTNNSFLCHFLNLFDYTGYVTGTTRLKLTQTKLREIPIPLPPLNEQKRLAERLDKIIPRIEVVKSRLDKIPSLIKRYRQSILNAAVTGKLTEKWREEHPDINELELTKKSTKNIYQIPKNWKFYKLNDIIIKLQAGKNFSCPETPVTTETVGIVKISAVTWDKFDPMETKTVNEKNKINKDFFIKKGDFLISRANTIELVGSSVIVDKIDYQIMISDKVWRVVFKNENKYFVNYYLKSAKGRHEIESRSTGTQNSMRNISQTAFRDIEIPLPPIEEQEEIVRQVDKYFVLADTLEIHYKNAKEKVDKITQSVLAKAFRGELVTPEAILAEKEGRDFESAEQLLERIISEKNNK